MEVPNPRSDADMELGSAAHVDHSHASLECLLFANDSTDGWIMLHCSKCKSEVPTGEGYCPQCFEPVEQPKRPGWWRRFLNALFGGTTQVTIATQTAFSGFQRIEYVDPTTGERTQVQALDDVPVDLPPQL